MSEPIAIADVPTKFDIAVQTRRCAECGEPLGWKSIYGLCKKHCPSVAGFNKELYALNERYRNRCRRHRKQSYHLHRDEIIAKRRAAYPQRKSKRLEDCGQERGDQL
jgi:hypothetical protein